MDSTAGAGMPTPDRLGARFAMHARSAAGRARRARVGQTASESGLVPHAGGALLLLGAALALGCAQPGSVQTVPNQLAELACIGRCKSQQEACNADARHDYRQCQAGYTQDFTTYRWCLASAMQRGECGYPGWPCAENLYGYCANRATECARACRAGP
jgi:hypothetical protein